MKVYRYILIQNGSKCFDIDTEFLLDPDDPIIDELIETYNRYIESYFSITNRALFQFVYEIQIWNYHLTNFEIKPDLKPYLWVSYDTKYPYYVERPYFLKSKKEFDRRNHIFYEKNGYRLQSLILYRSPFQKSCKPTSI